MDFACSTNAAENRTKWKRIAAKSSVVRLRFQEQNAYRLFFSFCHNFVTISDIV